jgi:hypothetical protein
MIGSGNKKKKLMHGCGAILYTHKKQKNQFPSWFRGEHKTAQQTMRLLFKPSLMHGVLRCKCNT